MSQAREEHNGGNRVIAIEDATPAFLRIVHRPQSLRSRLALWNAVVILLTLLVKGVVVYQLVTYFLVRDLDGRLQAQATKLEAMTQARTGHPVDATFLGQLVRGDVINEFTTNSIYIKVFDKNNSQPLAISPYLSQVSLPLAQPDFVAATHGQQALSSWQNKDGTQVHALTIGLRDKNGRLIAVAQVSESLQVVRQVQGVLATALVIGALIAVIVGYSVVFWLTSRELLPLSLLSTAMRDVSTQQLQVRLHPQKPPQEIRMLVEAFNRMMERLEISFGLQQRFVADLSHELRTPLAAIQGQVEVLLLHPNLNDEVRQDLEQTASEVRRLTRLVANLLTTSRVDIGILPQPFIDGVQYVELDALVTEVARQARYLNQQSNITLGRLEQVRVLGDRDLLKQLLFNIIDNALTHAGPHASVQLALLHSRREEREWALIKIEDNGPGIDAEDLPHIFERHYQAKSAHSKAGSGLGLYIARLIAEAHHGYMTVSSQPGQGTHINIWLPAFHEE